VSDKPQMAMKAKKLKAAASLVSLQVAAIRAKAGSGSIPNEASNPPPNAPATVNGASTSPEPERELEVAPTRRYNFRPNRDKAYHADRPPERVARRIEPSNATILVRRLPGQEGMGSQMIAELKLTIYAMLTT
jgi:hypothetical protein